MGSYNYLGFAAADEYCTPRAIETLKRFSPSTCSARVDGGMHTILHDTQYMNLVSSYAIMQPGTTILHTELEENVAKFVGKPAAIVFGMGYVTNSAVLPVLMGKVWTVASTRAICH